MKGLLLDDRWAPVTSDMGSPAGAVASEKSKLEKLFAKAFGG